MTLATEVAIVGADTRARRVQTALQAAGVTDIAMLDEVHGSAFDDDADSWVLQTADTVVRAGVVVAAHPSAFVPWIPDLFGRSDFRGDSFPAAQLSPNFHPAGKRIAVIGTDSHAGHHLSRLVESAKSVTIIAHPPRRVVTDAALWPTRAKRWLLRRTPPVRPVAKAPIDAITSTGIRTTDGVEYPFDVIIYGTGFTVGGFAADDAPLTGAGGVTLRQAWYDGMEPFLGVAVRGFPNYFFLAGPDTGAQAGYIAECVAQMQRSGSRRIEVRRSNQQVFNEKAQLAPPPSSAVVAAFDLSSSAPDYEDTYDGAATLEIGGIRHPVRVRLCGHLDPLDGSYHWQGTVLDVLPDDALKRARVGTLVVGQRSAPARIVEQTPWGTHSVAGVGAPPYALSG
ncbi:DUF4873 domain-containing protein [Mycobacterium asiaticum]|uniref:DUF4873 domain-containing protein n=1 Tax=Mycobacterium asiaticum TaxID=1790 RepID=UPI000B23F288|nr:DUF4873 domain-containing protein [Mycobacterium asiaticum]